MNTRIQALCAVGVSLILAACGGPAPQEPSAAKPDRAPPQSAAPPPHPQDAPPPAPTEEASATGRVELMFYDDRPQAGAVETPLFAVFTEQSSIEGSTVTFEEAEAVVYGAGGAESRILAGGGTFDRASGQSTLTDGVTFEGQGLRVSLPGMIWDNAQREARSEGPAQVEKPGLELEGQNFHFSPETGRLGLTQVTGYFELTNAPGPNGADLSAEEPGEAGGYSRVRIAPAGSLELIGGRPTQVAKGLKLVLEPTSPDAAPMEFEAQEARFLYEDVSQALHSILLLGGVEVAGPMGAIAADAAELGLRPQRFAFSGKATAASETLGSLEAGEIVFTPGVVHLEGNAAAVLPGGLRAQAEALTLNSAEGELQAKGGVRVSSGSRTIEAGLLQYDLNTQQVAASEGVRIEIEDAEIEAGTVEGNLARNALAFAGGIKLQDDDGILEADQAVLNERPGRVVLRGNVRGGFAGFEGLRASRIERNAQSGEARIANLRLERLPMALAAADGPMAFRSAALTKAADVRVKGGKVQRILGGVGLVLNPAKVGAKPLRLEADRAAFDYGEGGSSPVSISFEGNVRTDGPLGKVDAEKVLLRPGAEALDFEGGVGGSLESIPEFKAEALRYRPDKITLEGGVEVALEDGRIQAGSAQWQPESQQAVFTGEVVCNTAMVQDLQTDRLVYDFETGQIVLGPGQASEVPMQRAAPTEAPVELRPASITDWPALLRELRLQAAREGASPGKHIFSLLPEEVRAGIARISLEHPPNNPTQQRITEELNSLLRSTAFYEAAAWQGIPMDASATRLLEEDPQTLDEELLLLRNRRLFEAAFPSAVEKYAPDAPAAPEGP